jgi:cardiolipin synthase
MGTGDHTRTTIIDETTAFVGGMNIGREHRYDCHDLMMEVTGPVVDQLQFESDKAWARGGLFGDFANAVRFLRGKKERADRGGYPVRILQTKNFDSEIHKAQIAAMNWRKHGVRIYEYPGMSHVKAAIYDGWACVGSANFDKLSLEINKELNLATSDPETVDALLEQVFIPDLTVSREINRAVDVTVAMKLAEIMVDEAL